MEVQELGLYMIRGDTVVTVGEVDADKEQIIDYSKIKAAPIKPTGH